MDYYDSLRQTVAPIEGYYAMLRGCNVCGPIEKDKRDGFYVRFCEENLWFKDNGRACEESDDIIGLLPPKALAMLTVTEDVTDVRNDFRSDGSRVMTEIYPKGTRLQFTEGEYDGERTVGFFVALKTLDMKALLHNYFMVSQKMGYQGVPELEIFPSWLMEQGCIAPIQVSIVHLGSNNWPSSFLMEIDDVKAIIAEKKKGLSDEF